MRKRKDIKPMLRYLRNSATFLALLLAHSTLIGCVGTASNEVCPQPITIPDDVYSYFMEAPMGSEAQVFADDFMIQQEMLYICHGDIID